MKTASVGLLVPLLASALSAQASPSVRDVRQPGQGGEGITVKVLAPSSLLHLPLRYELSEPGYVAAFIVYPGAGVRLLYPTVDVSEKLQYAGYHTDNLVGAAFDNDVYRAVLGPRTLGPAYLYVIASRTPLDVARYVHRPMRLASAIGWREAQSFYNDVAFDALLNNAISLGDDASWDSDVYMLWPGTSDAGARADYRYRYTLCTDGTMRLVPDNYPFVGCPGQTHLLVNPVAHPAQTLASAARARVQTAEPTVLPTIIGNRQVNDQRAKEVQLRVAERTREPLQNGSRETIPQSGTQDNAVQLGAIAVVPGSMDSKRRNRDELHAEYSPERRAREADAWRMRQQAAQLSRDPQLAPNPALSPNPQLGPDPGFPADRVSDRMGESVAQWSRDHDNSSHSRIDARGETRTDAAIAVRSDASTSNAADDQIRQSRQQFREARQEQAQQRREAPAPSTEPIRPAPAPSPVQVSSPKMDAPTHGGRVVDQ